jgi:hypothetical protein
MANDSEPLDLTGTPEEFVKKIYGVDREQWGRWVLNHETDCLVYTNPKYPALAYDIPLVELKTQGQAFGWIRQLEEKTWCSEEDLGHLVRAIFAIMTHQRVLGTSPAKG